MDTMYDKLGDLLRDYIESGELPKPRKKTKPIDNSENLKNTIPANLVKEFNIFGYTETLPEFPEIRSKYAKLLKEVHPDTSEKNISSPTRIMELTEAFEKIKKIYEKE